MPFRTLELLESLISGHQLSPEELDGLVADQVPEDLFLDYKHGRLLANHKAARTMREYLSAFANSEGGVLFVGVDNQNWEITGCSAPGGGDLAGWLGALYVMSRNSPPAWHQVSLTVDGPLLKWVTAHPRQELTVGDLLHLARLVGERPVVALDGLRTE